MAKKKKLNINELLKEDKLFEKETPIQINDKVTLYYAQKFGFDKIDILLMDLMETIKFAQENGHDFPSTDEHVIQYLDFLIFKHFTNIQEALEGADYYMNIATYTEAYKKGWMLKVMNDFDYEEVGKVYEKFNLVVQNGEKFNRLQEKEKQKLLNIVKNETLRKKLTSGDAIGEESKSIPQS